MPMGAHEELSLRIQIYPKKGFSLYSHFKDDLGFVQFHLCLFEFSFPFIQPQLLRENHKTFLRPSSALAEDRPSYSCSNLCPLKRPWKKMAVLTDLLVWELPCSLWSCHSDLSLFPFGSYSLPLSLYHQAVSPLVDSALGFCMTSVDQSVGSRPSWATWQTW